MGIEKPFAKTNNAKEKLEPTYLPDRFFETMRSASLRFPQNAPVITLLLADTALKDPAFDAREFALMPWNPKHVHDMFAAMHRAHTARHVPAASAREMPQLRATIEASHGKGSTNEVEVLVDEDQILSAMNAMKTKALDIIGTLAGLGSSSMPNSSEINKRLEDKNVRENVRRTAKVFADVLNGPKGDHFGNVSRDTFDFRTHGVPSSSNKLSERRRIVHKESVTLYQEMIDACRAEGLELSHRACVGIFGLITANLRTEPEG